MKNILFLSLVLLVCCGCHAIVSAPETEKETAEAKGVRLLSAIQEKDFSRYTAIAGERENADAEKDFLRSCKLLEREYGTIRKISFLATLRTPLFFSQLFLVECCRRGNDGNEVCQDLLFQLLWDTPSAGKLLGVRPR